MHKLMIGMIALSAAIAGSLLHPHTAQAATFAELNLNCVISGNVGSQNFSGGPTCGLPAPEVSFGRLTLQNEGNGVRLNLDLTGTVNKILEVNLNYLDSKFSNASPFAISSSSIVVDENDVRANGYQGRLDLAIPRNGNIGTTDTFSALISLANGGVLTYEDLLAKDTLNNIFAAVHIGNYGDNPGEAGEGSIWVGATSATAIPTPALLPGLIGLGLAALRKKRDAAASQDT